MNPTKWTIHLKGKEKKFMAFSDESGNSMVMPVSPMGNGNGYGFGNDGW